MAKTSQVAGGLSPFNLAMGISDSATGNLTVTGGEPGRTAVALDAVDTLVVGTESGTTAGTYKFTLSGTTAGRAIYFIL